MGFNQQGRHRRGGGDRCVGLGLGAQLACGATLSAETDELERSTPELFPGVRQRLEERDRF
jgi:hypothetical protein